MSAFQLFVLVVQPWILNVECLAEVKRSEDWRMSPSPGGASGVGTKPGKNAHLLPLAFRPAGCPHPLSILKRC
jgi:hypothetical protein